MILGPARQGASSPVFVDGGSGTTGLGIASGLSSRRCRVKTIAEDKRKDPGAKKR